MKTIKIVSLLGALSLFIPFTSCTVTTDGAGGYTVKPDPASVEALSNAAVRQVIRSTK